MRYDSISMGEITQNIGTIRVICSYRLRIITAVVICINLSCRRIINKGIFLIQQLTCMRIYISYITFTDIIRLKVYTIYKCNNRFIFRRVRNLLYHEIYIRLYSIIISYAKIGCIMINSLVFCYGRLEIYPCDINIMASYSFHSSIFETETIITIINANSLIVLLVTFIMHAIISIIRSVHDEIIRVTLLQGGSKEFIGIDRDVVICCRIPDIFDSTVANSLNNCNVRARQVWQSIISFCLCAYC